MAAVPIYVWNGTAWQETGPTIPASPIKYQASAPSSPSTGDIWVDSDADVTTGSQQFQRFRFVASGGETTISGNDANGATLAYTAGLEQVVLNGAVLVRGHDYTATNGTSITGLSPALVANDVLEVFSFIAFTVANTYTQSQVDGLIAQGPSFGARMSSGQTVTANTWTKMDFITEDWDTNNCYDTTLKRFTPNVAGYYQVNLNLMSSGTTTSNIYKNGAAGRNGTAASVNAQSVASAIFYMNGTTDYIEAFGNSTSTTFYSSASEEYFSAALIRKA